MIKGNKLWLTYKKITDMHRCCKATKFCMNLSVHFLIPNVIPAMMADGFNIPGKKLLPSCIF